nr:MAG TPA: hypothetical protein [Caudoviricetes sp.]
MNDRTKRFNGNFVTLKRYIQNIWRCGTSENV